MYGLFARVQGRMTNATGYVPRMKGYKARMNAVVARDTGCMPRMHAFIARTSHVGLACVHTHGACNQCVCVCHQSLDPCRHSCGVCVDTHEETQHSFGTCKPTFGAADPDDVLIAVSSGTIQPDRDANPWMRFMRGSKRMSFDAVRHLEKTRRADLWLAHGGPQTGHELAQACPSKHPDGYRETLFRRCSI